MRVLVTTFDYIPSLGGVAKCSQELAKALALEAGVELKVIAPASDNPSVDAAYDAKNPFETIRLRLPKRPELASPVMAIAIARILKSWKPSLVLDTLWFPCSIATRIALRATKTKGCKHAILVHGVEVLESNTTMRKRLRARLAFYKRRVFQSASFILPVSTFTASLVEKNCGVSTNKIVQIFNGVNRKDFFPKVPALDYHKSDKKVLFTLTRLEDYKGIDITLKALSLLKTKNFSYLIGGIGPDRPRLEGLVKELGLGENVLFLGKVPDERVCDYYNLCDLFVLNSRVDWKTPNVEGFGLVYLEAAACGKPSIAPNMGGPVDVVVDGKTGRLVDPQNPEGMALVLEELLQSPRTLIDMGQNAMARAQEFSWTKVADTILQKCR